MLPCGAAPMLQIVKARHKSVVHGGSFRAYSTQIFFLFFLPIFDPYGIGYEQVFPTGPLYQRLIAMRSILCFCPAAERPNIGRKNMKINLRAVGTKPIGFSIIQAM
jgi:hypothetical protein